MSPQLFSQKVTARAACLAWLSAVSVGGQGPAAVDPSAHALPRRPVRTKGRHRDGRRGKCSLEGGCWHMVEWRGISCFPAGPAPLPRSVHPRLPGARGTGRGGAQGPGQAAHLERSWLEPRLSTGEMLAEWAECRRAACLLGDAGRDPALAAVRDRDRLFFFFSWGLLEGKRA